MWALLFTVLLATAGCVSQRAESLPPGRKVVGAREVLSPQDVGAPAPATEPASVPEATEGPAAQDPTRATNETSPPLVPVGQAPATQDSNPQDPARQDPLIRFGPQTVVHPDGQLTKFFPVRSERGKLMAEFLGKYASIPAEQIEIVPAADEQETRITPFAQPSAPARVPISDWVVVTGSYDEIDRADRFVNLYFSSIPQIEIEARIAEVTTSDVLDIGVRSTDPSKAAFQSGKHNFVSALDTNFPNVSNTSEGLLSLTAVQGPVEFQATLELLASTRNVDIISTPRIAVRNGGRAEIVNGNEIPYAEITTIVGGVPTSTIRYKQTGVKLYVTPYLSGRDTVSLTIEVELSIPTNVTETSTASVSPIIATRSAKTDVHIRDGNTFVVGGLISTNNFEQVQKVPILGDIPILGFFFRSTLTQKTYTEVIFFITPRVLRDPGSPAVIVPRNS